MLHVKWRNKTSQRVVSRITCWINYYWTITSISSWNFHKAEALLNLILVYFPSPNWRSVKTFVYCYKLKEIEKTPPLETQYQHLLFECRGNINWAISSTLIHYCCSRSSEKAIFQFILSSGCLQHNDGWRMAYLEEYADGRFDIPISQYLSRRVGSVSGWNTLFMRHWCFDAETSTSYS